MCYKLGKTYLTSWGTFVLLQIVPDFLTNWRTSTIKNLGKCYYELGQLLQIKVTFITKWGSHDKMGQYLLQIGTGLTNQDNYYKFGHTLGHKLGYKLRHKSGHLLQWFEF